MRNFWRLLGMSGAFSQTLEGGSGNDAVGGGNLNDWISGGDGNDTLAGLDGNDSIAGGNNDDFLSGGNGADSLLGGSGNDLIFGGSGSDWLDGGDGEDRANYSNARSSYRFALDGSNLIVFSAEGTDTLQGIETLRFGSDAPIAVSSLSGAGAIEETITLNQGGVTTKVFAEVYSGPVSWLQYQLLGSAGGDIAVGTSRNDFFNLLDGDDAANGGAGDDVLDGGTGSNFLTGGTGRDDFFLDGRGGTITWATITDWQADERLSVWGWRPGVSKVQWVADAGAPGYTGVTMHGDLDGNGVIDTSVTWSGLTIAQLPTPLEYDGLLWFT
jgi:serralysin